jgi:hypothetical protein
MTMIEQLQRATASGSISSYSAVMDEISNWSCRQVAGGIAWIDPYGDQSGDLFESFEDLVGETYDTLERGNTELQRQIDQL